MFNLQYNKGGEGSCQNPGRDLDCLGEMFNLQYNIGGEGSCQNPGRDLDCLGEMFNLQYNKALRSFICSL